MCLLLFILEQQFKYNVWSKLSDNINCPYIDCAIKVNVWIIVQLSKDLMDWVLQRLCFAFGDTDRSVSWTSAYSLIRRTWGRMEFIHMLTPGESFSSTEIRTHNHTWDRHTCISDTLCDPNIHLVIVRFLPFHLVSCHFLTHAACDVTQRCEQRYKAACPDHLGRGSR